MKKVFFVSTENGCNNNCIGCADDNYNRPKNGRPIQEIFKDMELGANKSYKNLHLAGGEVTIQDNIFDIIEYAKKLYNEVYITSNGRMFSYMPFARKMVNLDVTLFRITLCGPNQKIHEAWTRTPGSFEQTIKGIQNLRSLTKNVCVNYLIWKKSLDKINELIKIIKRLKIDKVSFFNLVPLGRARVIYPKICANLINMLQLEKAVNPTYFSSVDLEDFPLCIFSDSFIKRDNIHVVDTSGKVYEDNEGNVENYSLFAAREYGFCINSNLDIQKEIQSVRKKFCNYRRKIKECGKCSKKNVCGGLFDNYIKIKGINEVKEEIKFLRKMQDY